MLHPGITLVSISLVALAGGLAVQAPQQSRLYLTSAPSTASAGDDGILALDAQGRRFSVVPPAPGLRGLREVVLSPDGDRLYAMQSHHTLGVHRILVFEPDGTPVDVVDGLGSTLMAMTVLDDGLLYVLQNEFTSSRTKLLRVDPVSKQVAEVLDFGAPWGVLDMASSGSDLYFTGGPVSTSAADGVFKITPQGALSRFAVLPGAFGLAVDRDSGTLWVSANAGAFGRVYSVDPEGNVSLYAFVAGVIQPSIRGLAFDATRGQPIVGLSAQGRVGHLDPNGVLHPLADVPWPVDIDLR